MGQSMTASALQDISTVDLVLALVSRDAEDLVLGPLGVDIDQLVELTVWVPIRLRTTDNTSIRTSDGMQRHRCAARQRQPRRTSGTALQQPRHAALG
jgi:hypothetical protein